MIHSRLKTFADQLPPLPLETAGPAALLNLLTLRWSNSVGTPSVLMYTDTPPR